jgi:hypothetical protein
MHSNPAASGTDNSFRYHCSKSTSSGVGVFFLRQDEYLGNFKTQMAAAG